MDRRKIPILIDPQTFISNSGNQPESGYKWVFKGALCALWWTMPSFFHIKIHFCTQILFETFLLCLMILKCCNINVSREGSLCVHMWMARHVSFWESVMCTVCQIGNASQRRHQVHGSGGFLLLWLESNVSLCSVVPRYVMSWGKSTHLHCSLVSRVREGSLVFSKWVLLANFEDKWDSRAGCTRWKAFLVSVFIQQQ